jgi:invasion protein IalB
MVPAMQRLALSLALALLLAPSALVVAQAPEITKLGNAQGWEAYTDAGKGAKICYLIGKPAKSEPAGAKRSAIFASVTHRPGEKRTNEVSFTSGYLFKEGSDADLAIDSKTFSLFTNKEGAWTRDAATDKAVVDALAKGKQAVIKGTSARGTATTDTYALAGFSQALAQIDKACGVKR